MRQTIKRICSADARTRRLIERVARAIDNNFVDIITPVAAIREGIARVSIRHVVGFVDEANKDPDVASVERAVEEEMLVGDLLVLDAPFDADREEQRHTPGYRRPPPISPSVDAGRPQPVGSRKRGRSAEEVVHARTSKRLCALPECKTVPALETRWKAHRAFMERELHKNMLHQKIGFEFNAGHAFHAQKISQQLWKQSAHETRQQRAAAERLGCVPMPTLFPIREPDDEGVDVQEALARLRRNSHDAAVVDAVLKAARFQQAPPVE